MAIAGERGLLSRDRRIRQLYFISAAVLGGILLAGVIRVSRSADWTKPAWWVYKYSLLYLALLFLAMVIDRKVLGT